MTKARFVVLVLLAVALVAGQSFAQEATETPTPFIVPASEEEVNPNANISWPLPVYVVRGEYTIRGSANLPDMTNYFIEFRALGENLQVQDESAAWFPVSLPSATAVQNDVLAVWDTTMAEDGIYELRLTVNLASGETVTAFVRPIRIENETPEGVEVPPPQETEEAPIPTQAPPPTVPPATETPTGPTVTVSVPNANVRQGDSTLYGIIASLPEGTTLPVIALSANNSGWFLVRLPDDRQGWVAPSVVVFNGSSSGLPRLAPPPPPVTPTPTNPPATNTPTTQANLVAGNVRLDPAQPTCNQTFNVQVDLANLGSENTTVGGTFIVRDLHNGEVQAETQGPIPTINAGQTVPSANIPLTVSTWYDEPHTIVVILNPNGAIPETTSGDNQNQVGYTLQRGSC